MAIEIRRPTFYKISAVKEFINRTNPRQAFWKRYTKMCEEGSTIISFYGAGGVGKSALIRKLEEEIKHHQAFIHNNVQYIKYDFSHSTDIREVLGSLKVQLAAYGCNFPLFDVGEYYYSLKIGQNATAPRTPSAFSQIPWVKNLTKSLSKATFISGNAQTFFNTAKILFKATTEVKGEHWLDTFIKVTLNGLGTFMPIVRTVTTLMSVADMFLEDYLKRKGILDEFHQSIRNELNILRQERDPMVLYEYLPTLFAVDVSDWIAKTDNKLIVFLDNYESLINVTSYLTNEQLKRDLWLRGYNGLIHIIPNTLWAIAGRSELYWNGDLAEELDQHLIGALSPEDSNRFLEKAGIKNGRLRGKLVKLTKGYPIFLDLCVDVYVEHKRQHNNEEPGIEAFGKTREDVVGRILRYINTAGATAAKDMLEFLCVLNVWTDEIAYKIGKAALQNFSPNTYKLVKNFSFIRSGTIRTDKNSLTIYRFDKTIQSLLISDCDKYLVEDVRKAADDYFRELFANKNILDSDEIFCLKLWADMIVRFIDDAAKLAEGYRDYLSDRVLILIGDAKFDAAEEILRLFMDKLKNLKATDTSAYTDFEIDLGWLRRMQGKSVEAYELTKSAYEKRVRHCGEEDAVTVEAMHKLAISLSDLARHKDALELREKVLALRRQIYGEEHPDTLKAMNNLAVSLSALGRHKDAVTNLERALELYKKIFGEKNVETIGVINNLANSLKNVGRHKDAVKFHEEAVALNREILGNKHPETIVAMNNLAISLRAYGHREEAAILQKKVLSLSKEILGEEHPNTLAAMNNLSVFLRELGQFKKALSLQRKVLELRRQLYGEEHPDTLKAMNNLAISLRSVNRFEEAASLHEKILELCRQLYGEEHSNTLDAMNNFALFLRSAGHHEKAIEMQQSTLDLSKKLLGNEHPYTLKATNNLAWTLTMRGHYAEATELMETALPLCRRILGEADINTLGAADTLIHALDGLGRHAETVELLRESLELSRKNFGDSHPLTVSFARRLADISEP